MWQSDIVVVCKEQKTSAGINVILNVSSIRISGLWRTTLAPDPLTPQVHTLPKNKVRLWPDLKHYRRQVKEFRDL